MTPDEFTIQWQRTDYTTHRKSWRSAARHHIYNIVVNRLEREEDHQKIGEAIDQGYPFGKREYSPYRIWLEERNLARWILGLDPLTTRNRKRLAYFGHTQPEPHKDQVTLWEETRDEETH